MSHRNRHPLTFPRNEADQVTPALGTSDTFEVELGISRVECILVRAKIRHVSGSAATFTPEVWSADPATANPIRMELSSGGVAIPVADTWDTGGNLEFSFSSYTGKLWIKPQPDAGADNIFMVALSLLTGPGE